jgi:hypothetical protein
MKSNTFLSTKRETCSRIARIKPTQEAQSIAVMIVKTKMEANPTAVETTACELLPLPTSNADGLRSTKSEEKHNSEWPPLVVPFDSLSQPTSTSDDVVLYAMKHSEDLLFPEKVRTAVLSDSFFGIRQ